MNDPSVCEWRAHLHEGPDEWMSRTVRLTLFRRDGNGGGEQIIGWDDNGQPIAETVPPGHVLRPGFRIPADVLPSLRDAIEPGPVAGEVRRLEEALAVERERVNALLRLEPAPGPAERPATPFGGEIMPCTCVPTADGGLRRRTDIDCTEHPESPQ